MVGNNCLVLICICMSSSQIVHGLLEEDNLPEIVARLQISVQNLQGQVKALTNKSCVKLPPQFAYIFNHYARLTGYGVINFS